MQIELAAENALLIRFAEHTYPNLPSEIQSISQRAKAYFNSALIDWVPSYTTLLMIFDLTQIDLLKAQNQLSQLLSTSLEAKPAHKPRCHHLPICYEAEFAPDLAALATAKQLQKEEVIQIHSETLYQVYALGFAPAFAYLGELDTRICHPRHATPRPSVAAGSLGIADNQTAIYPSASPAGWQIIGRTPIKLSIDQPENLTRFQAGDSVRFFAINIDQFHHLSSLGFSEQENWLENRHEL